MSKLREFIGIYKLYSLYHTRTYAIKRAWHIVVRGADF
jgi:hypothetical protein